MTDFAQPSPDRPRPFTRHYEGAVRVSATQAAVFDRLDDHEHLGAHMRKPTAMMGGGRMTYSFDAGRGREVGSHIRMGGSAFGISLDVDEVVTERNPPHRKVWRTVGSPRLLIIGEYEMGFSCEPANDGTRLRVWIDYSLPPKAVGKVLGTVFASAYARWCVRRMLDDASRSFATISRREG